jgi:hypothetical protein
MTRSLVRDILASPLSARGPIGETARDIATLFQELDVAGRGFDLRGPSMPCALTAKRAAPSVVRSPSVIPFRPHQRVYMTVEPAASGEARQVQQFSKFFHVDSPMPSIKFLLCSAPRRQAAICAPSLKAIAPVPSGLSALIQPSRRTVALTGSLDKIDRHQI